MYKIWVSGLMMFGGGALNGEENFLSGRRSYLRSSPTPCSRSARLRLGRIYGFGERIQMVISQQNQLTTCWFLFRIQNSRSTTQRDSNQTNLEIQSTLKCGGICMAGSEKQSFYKGQPIQKKSSSITPRAVLYLL